MTVTRLPTSLHLGSDLSYRQLDYWTRCGLLRPYNGDPGSGYKRAWPSSELRTARLMARLVKAGLTVHAAHRVARGHFRLGPGITISITEEGAE